jgi:hypothetical protein
VKRADLLVSFVYLVCFVCLVNETNQMNKTDQMNQINPYPSRSSRLSRFSRPRLTNDESERTEGCRHRSQACSPQGVPMPIF